MASVDDKIEKVNVDKTIERFEADKSVSFSANISTKVKYTPVSPIIIKKSKGVVGEIDEDM